MDSSHKPFLQVSRFLSDKTQFLGLICIRTTLKPGLSLTNSGPKSRCYEASLVFNIFWFRQMRCLARVERNSSLESVLLESLVLRTWLLFDFLLAGGFLWVSRAELYFLPQMPCLETPASLWDSTLMWGYIGLLKMNFLSFVLDIFFLNFFCLYFLPLGYKFYETNDPGCVVQCRAPGFQPVVNTQCLLTEGMQV